MSAMYYCIAVRQEFISWLWQSNVLKPITPGGVFGNRSERLLITLRGYLKSSATPTRCADSQTFAMALLGASSSQLLESHKETTKGALKLLTTEDRQELKSIWNPFAIVRSICCLRVWKSHNNFLKISKNCLHRSTEWWCLTGHVGTKPKWSLTSSHLCAIVWLGCVIIFCSWQFVNALTFDAYNFDPDRPQAIVRCGVYYVGLSYVLPWYGMG